MIGADSADLCGVVTFIARPGRNNTNAKSGLPCSLYIFPGFLVNVMAREELLDSQLVPVILVKSQCAAASNGKAIAMDFTYYLELLGGS